MACKSYKQSHAIEFKCRKKIWYIDCLLTIRILEKFSKPSAVKSGVPSSMNDKSVRYMPKYGMQGGSHLCNASRIARNRPSEQTTDWSLDIVCLI